MADRLTELYKSEEVIYKRDFTADQRKKLAGEGKALSDGTYPIETQADLHPAAVLAQSGHGDVPAAKALIARRAKDLGADNPLEDKPTQTKKSEELALTCTLLKSEVEGKFYGVVLTPDLADSHGHIATPQDIEKACHDFMVDYAVNKAEHAPDIQHSGRATDADLLENAIAPQDLMLGEKPIVKGAWYQAWQVNDPLLKLEVDEGKIDSLSLEGTGNLTPIAT